MATTTRSFIGVRRKLHADVLPMPDEKSAGEMTIRSSEIYDFEKSAFGSARVLLGAEDAAEITDTITVVAEVSFDGGNTWVEAAEYSDLANGSGTITEVKEIDLAPRLRLRAEFDGTAELAEGHGIKVHVETVEYEPVFSRDFHGEVLVVDETLAADAEETSDVIELTGTHEKAMVVATADDVSDITDADVMVQYSYDGVFWWDGLDSAVDIDNGFVVAEVDGTPGRYARLVLSTAADTGEVTDAAGLALHLVEFYMGETPFEQDPFDGRYPADTLRALAARYSPDSDRYSPDAR